MLVPAKFTLQELVAFQFSVTQENWEEVFYDDYVWLKFIQCGRNVVTLYTMLDNPNRLLLNVLMQNFFLEIYKEC